jgi:hypothetical protein
MAVGAGFSDRLRKIVGKFKRHLDIEVSTDTFGLPQKHPFMLDMFENVDCQTQVECLVWMWD